MDYARERQQKKSSLKGHRLIIPIGKFLAKMVVQKFMNSIIFFSLLCLLYTYVVSPPNRTGVPQALLPREFGPDQTRHIRGTFLCYIFALRAVLWGFRDAIFLIFLSLKIDNKQKRKNSSRFVRKLNLMAQSLEKIMLNY